jgi:hypothetical protein
MNATRKSCYRLIQEVAVAQDKFCRYPGCNRYSLVGHHLFKRDRLATAFLPEAVWGLCLGHHEFAHKFPIVFKNAVISKIGYEVYINLLRKSHSTVKYLDYNKVAEELKEILHT